MNKSSLLDIVNQEYTWLKTIIDHKRQQHLDRINSNNAEDPTQLLIYFSRLKSAFNEAPTIEIEKSEKKEKSKNILNHSQGRRSVSVLGKRKNTHDEKESFTSSPDIDKALVLSSNPIHRLKHFKRSGDTVRVFQASSTPKLVVPSRVTNSSTHPPRQRGRPKKSIACQNEVTRSTKVRKRSREQSPECSSHQLNNTIPNHHDLFQKEYVPENNRRERKQLAGVHHSDTIQEHDLYEVNSRLIDREYQRQNPLIKLIKKIAQV